MEYNARGIKKRRFISALYPKVDRILDPDRWRLLMLRKDSSGRTQTFALLFWCETKSHPPAVSYRY